MSLKKILQKGNQTRIWLRDSLIPRYQLNYNNQGLINYIDIGSLRGLQPPWRSNAKSIRFLLNFDPNEEPKRTANSLTYNTAVWNTDETRPFYITKGRGGSGSSLLLPNYQYVRTHYEFLKDLGPRELADSWFERSKIVKTVDIQCRTLDHILEEEFPQTEFHFLKVDAQGAEYRILNGATSFLAQSCLGLHIELYNIPMYEGVVLFDEVVEYLAQFDFYLARKYPLSGTFDSQNDCVFLKRSKNHKMLTLIKEIYQLG